MESNRSHASIVNAWHRLWTAGRTTAIGSSDQTIRYKENNNRITNKEKIGADNKNINTGAEPKKLRRNQHHRHPSPTMTQDDQQNIHDGEAFGDKLTRKSENILRLMLHNVNRLPSSRLSDKSKKLISSIANKQFDLALITEVGLCWKLVKTNDQWHE
jgi:hypothetical protein